MAKFDINAYFMAIYNRRDAIIGKPGSEVLTVVYGIVDELGAGSDGSSGKKIGLVAIDTRCKSSDAMAHMIRYGAASAAHARGVHVALLGEKHDDRTDVHRGKGVGSQLGIGAFQPTLVLYEKGLHTKYPAPNVDASRIVTEEDIIPAISPRIKARSAIVAGYIALCMATEADRHEIVLFFGEEHRDIFDMLEAIAKNTKTSASLLSKYRYYQLVRSYTTRGNFEDPL